MTLKEYLHTTTFIRQIGISFAIVIFSGIVLLAWLSFATNHGEEITVPDIRGMREYEFKAELAKKELNYVFLDSADYNEKFPKYSVVEQNPLPDSKVKKGRKIYIKLNSSGFSIVSVPDLINKTYREAVPSINARGLRLGSKTYIHNIGKDVVLGMSCKGRKLTFGDKVYKSSRIDLVLGDGNPPISRYDDQDIDEAPAEE